MMIRHRRFVRLVLISVTATVVGGQLPLDGADALAQDAPEYRQNSSSAGVTTQLARLRADIRELAENQRKIAAQIEENLQRLKTLNTQVQRLQQQQTGAETGTAAEVRELRQKVGDLENALADEKQARRQADEKVINTIAEEIGGLAQAGDETASEPRARGTYTVQRGDTLSTIAQAFKVSVRDIKQLNDLQGDLIREGQKLLIPEE